MMVLTGGQYAYRRPMDLRGTLGCLRLVEKIIIFVPWSLWHASPHTRVRQLSVKITGNKMSENSKSTSKWLSKKWPPRGVPI